jgi:hypothetical protein
MQSPMYATPALSDPMLTYGPAVDRWARQRVGLHLSRWQRWLVDHVLEVDPATGRLRYREAVWSVARRNGKTTILRAVFGWLAEASPLWSLGAIAASTREQGYHALFAELAADVLPLGMEAQPTGARAGIGYDGSSRRVYLLSGKHDAARGRTFDVVALDEAQTATIDESTWAALEPTTRTRPDGMLIATGTAGTEGSVLFRRMYDRAILAAARPADDPRFGAFVWEGMTDDDRSILQANPGVADKLLPLDVLTASRRALSPLRFAAETCNKWVTDPSHAWAPPGAWDACADPASIAPADATPSFGVDVTPSWSRATIVAAVLDAERIHIEVARDYGAADVAAVERIIADVRELATRYPRARFAYDAASPIAAALRDLAGEGMAVDELGGGVFRQACQAFLGHVVAGTIRHRADPVLDAAARLAARSEDAESWRFVRRRSAGHIDALVAATCAVYVADRPAMPRPAIY